MSDKIMPMSEAVEGYDLFDKMKVQKGTTLSERRACYKVLIIRSRFRGTKVILRYTQYRRPSVQIVSNVNVGL